MHEDIFLVTTPMFQNLKTNELFDNYHDCWRTLKIDLMVGIYKVFIEHDFDFLKEGDNRANILALVQDDMNKCKKFLKAVNLDFTVSSYAEEGKISIYGVLNIISALKYDYENDGRIAAIRSLKDCFINEENNTYRVTLIQAKHAVEAVAEAFKWQLTS